jgi:hypothetical protein
MFRELERSREVKARGIRYDGRPLRAWRGKRSVGLGCINPSHHRSTAAQKIHALEAPLTSWPRGPRRLINSSS